ncbi:MAG: hypothetical protein AAFS11_09295, partial [Planctomycetota bacterium]
SWSFDGPNLNLGQVTQGDIRGFGWGIEVAGGRVYGETGFVNDAETLERVGRFPLLNANIEPIPEIGVTYFLGGGQLGALDNETFELIEIAGLGTQGRGIIEVFVAGPDALGYVTGDGKLGLITGVPVPGAGSLVAFVAFSAFCGWRRQRVQPPVRFA